jgi:hypothetical protein
MEADLQDGLVMMNGAQRKMREAKTANMDKKQYTKPELTLLGDVEVLTKGEGVRGSDDQWWFIHFGSERKGDDPTSGN